MADQIELNPDRPAWERQDGETDAQFRAFTVYLDLGRFRTLDKTSAALKRDRDGQTDGNMNSNKSGPGGHITDYSRVNRWVERSRAWDDHILKARREQQLEHMKHDLVDAADHARQIRDDARTDYDLFVMHIRSHLLFALDSKSKTGVISPKDLRELAQARDRLKELARDVFFGLEQQQANSDDHLDQLDPDLADLIAKVMAEHGKSRRDDG